MKKSVPAITPTPLTGKALLSKVKELSGVSRRETAKECGYFKILKSGQEQVNTGNFYNALLEAKGISIIAKAKKDGRGRDVNYKITVHQNGQIVIGGVYTKEMGLKEGDEFTIKLGYKHIRLESTSLKAEGK
jgi:hypothetical protein